MIARTLLVSLATLAITASGCGTISNLKQVEKDDPDRSGARIYGGVREELRFVTEAAFDAHPFGFPGVGVMFCGVDFPLTLIGDTITLPYTFWMQLDRSIRGHWKREITRTDQPGAELRPDTSERVAVGQPLADVHAKLLAAGAKDISDSIGIFALPPTRLAWYELCDGTCLCVRAAIGGKGEVRGLELGEPGCGYGEKVKWLGQKHREVNAIELRSP